MPKSRLRPLLRLAEKWRSRCRALAPGRRGIGAVVHVEPTNGARRIREMEHLQLEDRRLDGVERGPSLRFTFNGQEVPAYEGETVAAALLAAGQREWRR